MAANKQSTETKRSGLEIGRLNGAVPIERDVFLFLLRNKETREKKGTNKENNAKENKRNERTNKRSLSFERSRSSSTRDKADAATPSPTSASRSLKSDSLSSRWSFLTHHLYASL